MIYTPDQFARRQATPWTKVQYVLAPIQFLVFLVSLALVVRYLTTGEGYWATTISVWVKIALIWALTLSGMLWEKDVYGHYFMAKEFFWEDLGNLVAIITHNAYFVVQWLGWDERGVMTVMLIAYLTYMINAVQFIVKGIRAGRARRAMQARAGLTTVKS
jgi:3-vinyl bacteriochlorophyllide hydratase